MSYWAEVLSKFYFFGAFLTIIGLVVSVVYSANYVDHALNPITYKWWLWLAPLLGILLMIFCPKG